MPHIEPSNIGLTPYRTEPPRPRRNVLLVEDNPGDATLVTELIEAIGEHDEVGHVSSLEAAAELLAADEFVLVLLDLHLPDGSGVASVQRLRNVAPTPIVVLTGSDDEELALACIAAGADDYLSKNTLRVEGLRRAMRYALARHGEVWQRARADALQLRFATIVESSRDGIVSVGTDGNISTFNASAERLFAVSKRDAVGTSFEMLLGAPLRQDGRPFEAVHRRGDGSERILDVLASPLTSPRGDALGTVAVLRDVTESRRLEAKLQQAQKLESLGVLAGGIAHDFNNLLVGVLGNAGLARGDLPPGSPALPSIESIEVAAVRASELTRQLLAYAGKGRFIISRLDINALVKEMGHLLSAVIGKGVVLRYQFGVGLPAVEGDATQLRQVVMNLITNASDAIGERSGIVTVVTSLVDADRDYLAELVVEDEVVPGYYVCLQVSDSGQGMTPETRDRIFEPFFTTKFNGRGLGLAAVVGIVRSHRGAIKVYSEVGRGSTFKLVLPATPGWKAASETATGTPEASLPGGTILVVDDEETVRNVMKRTLLRAGFRVLTAQDGVEGVALFTKHREEIVGVILDVTMPRMGGDETFRRLRQLDPKVRVLLASGYSEQEATSQFAGKGLAGFVEKPFRPQALVEKVQAMLVERNGPSS